LRVAAECIGAHRTNMTCGILIFSAILAIAAPVASGTVGLQLFTVPDAASKPVSVAVWYPRDSAAVAQAIGPFSQTVALDGHIPGRTLPLILISHGTNESFSSHADTALALTWGFVVVALTLLQEVARQIGMRKDYVQPSGMGRKGRMKSKCLLAVLLLGVVSASPQTNAELKEQVRHTEAAFAKTMADRDLAAFAAFLSDEAVFVTGSGELRGAQQVKDGWKGYFTGAAAPFSWEPETVVVLDSGKLALSSGPVRDPAGKRIGTFTSTWRREGEGRWRIVLDKGCPSCNCGGGS
jgi:ketosteroid isomerase-like protein